MKKNRCLRVAVKFQAVLIFWVFCVFWGFLSSCSSHLGSDRNNYPGDGKVYKLRLNPPSGSKYTYTISNESDLHLEVDSKKIENIKKADVSIGYAIDRDSAGDFLLHITYDKIHVYTKSGDQVSELNSDNATNSVDPMERFLGALKGADIRATVGRTGEVKAVTGYTEIANHILEEATTVSLPDKQKVQQQWQATVEQGMIKKNMDQLFKLFPDSAVHIGDRWKMNSGDHGEIPFTVKNTFQLLSIRDGVAAIESSGEIVSDSTTTVMMSTEVSANLSGTQQGVYSMDVRTGMLLGCTVSAEIKGEILMMGRTIPVTIETKVKMEGVKVK